MSNSAISAKLNLVATMDVDALVDGAYFVKEAFKTILRKHGLHYDEDSHLVWIPPESKYDLIYETNNLRCKVISTIFALLSKAIKAKEKNRILIKDAVGIFGDKLTGLIKKYGGDPDYFLR